MGPSLRLPNGGSRLFGETICRRYKLAEPSRQPLGRSNRRKSVDPEAEVAPKMTGQGLTLMEVCAYDRPYGEF